MKIAYKTLCLKKTLYKLSLLSLNNSVLWLEENDSFKKISGAKKNVISAINSKSRIKTP